MKVTPIIYEFYALAFRTPIWLYRALLGWLLGYRFVLLTHTGRTSGLHRQTVLEIVRYDKASGARLQHKWDASTIGWMSRRPVFA